MIRAAQLQGGSRSAVVLTEEPRPGERQVRVRLAGCGVCASNLPQWEGREWFQYPVPPGVPGHEGWGVVDAVGPGTDPSWMGQAVACLSFRAFAETDVADVDHVVALPRGRESDPLPGEPLACAVNVVDRAGITPDETVVVVGIGFLGALVVRLAAAAGARVVAISRRPWAVQFATDALGAVAGCTLGGRTSADDVVSAVSGSSTASCVIEAGGVQETLDVAARLTGVRGRLVIAGFHQDGLRTINLQEWNWRGFDVINAHERDPRAYVRGMRKGFDLIERGVVDLDPLLTHHVGLDDIDGAFRLMRDRPDGFLKAVVRMS